MRNLLPKGWTCKKLNGLGFVGRGKSKHRPRNDESLYGGEYPFIQTGEVKAVDLYLTEYSQTYNDKGFAQSKLWEPETLCITIAANIAETAILKVKACFPDSIVGFVADPEEADVRFIKYYIDTIKLRMQNVSRGTTQDNLSLDKLLMFDFFTPPLETQRKIAYILSAYDDLIENNTRRIKTLEEMARMIYRNIVETHCNASLQAAMIPVTEAVEVNPKTHVPKDGEKSFVPMSCLSTDSMLISDIEYRTGNSGSKFQNGDTLFARITPCLENGKTGYVQFLPDAEAAAFGSTEFIVLRSKTLCPEYVYLMARSSEFREIAIKSMSGATGRQRVREKCFEQFFIAQPDAITLEKFSGTTAKMFKQIQVLEKKNQNLRQTRDLLLPKLISGEVAV